MSEDLLRRLEALNRGPLPELARPKNARPPAAVASAAEVNAASRGQTADHLPGLLRRGEAVETPAGEHWRVCVALDEVWPGGSRLAAARQDYLKQLHEAAHQAVEPSVVMHAEFAALVGALPDRALLLDLETCGLAGAALFLIGVLRQIDGRPVVELLFARNYAEERAVLESFWRLVAEHDVLVTFNGKTFDWPMVRERSIRHRIDRATTARSLPHVDILHHARRRWRKQLPDCRLQTLETHVCRRRRVGDVPGHRIPAIYAEYVRNGFEREIDAVLYHNAIDLVTLFDLSLRLAG